MINPREVMFFAVHITAYLVASKVIDMIPTFSEAKLYLVADVVLRYYIFCKVIEKYEEYARQYNQGMTSPGPLNGFIAAFFMTKLRDNILKIIA